MNIHTYTHTHTHTHRLSGGVPDSIGALSNLRAFSAPDNALCGDLPASITKCRQLRSLTLFPNRFTPEQIRRTSAMLDAAYGKGLLYTMAATDAGEGVVLKIGRVERAVEEARKRRDEEDARRHNAALLNTADVDADADADADPDEERGGGGRERKEGNLEGRTAPSIMA